MLTMTYCLILEKKIRCMELTSLTGFKNLGLCYVRKEVVILKRVLTCETSPELTKSRRMVASVTLELQKQYEEMDVPFILTHLCELYNTCVRAKHYEVLSALYVANSQRETKLALIWSRWLATLSDWLAWALLWTINLPLAWYWSRFLCLGLNSLWTLTWVRS